MELEGLGVSLVGRTLWVHSSQQGGNSSARIPWEYINSVNYSMRILVRGNGALMAAVEGDWTCVWSPQTPKDWSCIATLVRSIGVGSCLLVFDTLSNMAPSTFWTYLETLIHDGKTILTRVWINAESPTWIPDAIFFPPVADGDAADVLALLQSVPGRAGHGAWASTFHSTQEWMNIVVATRTQGLGLVLSDVEERTWTLFWFKPADSLPTMEVCLRRGTAWAEAGLQLLKQFGAPQ